MVLFFSLLSNLLLLLNWLSASIYLRLDRTPILRLAQKLSFRFGAGYTKNELFLGQGEMGGESLSRPGDNIFDFRLCFLFCYVIFFCLLRLFLVDCRLFYSLSSSILLSCACKRQKKEKKRNTNSYPNTPKERIILCVVPLADPALFLRGSIANTGSHTDTHYANQTQVHTEFSVLFSILLGLFG